MNAEQAIKKINKIRGGESIQSKDQERIVFDYEKYINKSQTRREGQNNIN